VFGVTGIEPSGFVTAFLPVFKERYLFTRSDVFSGIYWCCCMVAVHFTLL
jgi:hypothetical protein